MREPDNRADTLPGLLAEILDRNCDKWFKFVLRVVGNREDAEDAIQEGVSRVLGCDRVFQTSDEARMYLARAISNTAFEIYKRRKRQQFRQTTAVGYLLAAGVAHDPYTLIEEKEKENEKERLLSVLDDALGRLPVREYEALCITVLEADGVSIRDVGTAHGIPYSTLRHRRIGGLRRLRKYINRMLRQRPPALLLA